MMNAQSGVKARRANGAGGSGPEDGIAVVELCIGAARGTVAAEVRPHQGFPIIAGGNGFAVVGVARFDLPDEVKDVLHFIMMRVGTVEGFGLVANLGLDDGLPQSFFEGVAGGNLLLQDVCRVAMALHRMREGDRVKVGSTGDDDCLTLCQSIENSA